MEVAEVSCKICGKNQEPERDFYISKELSVCVDCIRKKFDKALPFIEEAHRKVRDEFRLPVKPPKTKGGIKCTYCVNECILGEGERGFCGIRKNEKGRFVDYGGAALNYNYDNLPTNCVADWVCPGGTGCGYPRYAYSKGAEYGYKNLSVFYGACSFNCLFCQNWHFRDHVIHPHIVTADELANAVDERTSCICYFGGDPTPQMDHAIKASRLALKKAEGRILRICWETNGSMNPNVLKTIAQLSLDTGGCVKFDLKAWSEEVNIALCGVTNKRTLENFKILAEMGKGRKTPLLAVASTLLVPGYVDKSDVSQIAKFIASLDPEIPYSLLAFYPQFYMYDLPTTSWTQAKECQQAALEAGVKNVRIGNVHLLR